jgi:integrase
MASIATRNGRRAVQFIAPDGKRCTLSLGKVSQRAADQFALFLDRLLAARKAGLPLDGPTAAWLAGLPPATRQRLAAAGLIDAPANERPVVTLGDVGDAYLQRGDVKAGTKTVRGIWLRELIEFFGDRPLAEVTGRDAEALRDWLVAKGHAPATIARRLRFARQLFETAVRLDAITKNPLAVLKFNFREGPGNPRDYLPLAAVEQLLAACPPAWRVLVALARFAALRAPSEVLLLRWADVDLPARRLVVRSPKTESAGKAWRVVPVVPRLAEALQEAWDTAPDGAEFVVDLPQYRVQRSAGWLGCNIRTQFARYLRAAGLPPLKRPFRVLRSSCISDWAREFPIHSVADWAGHTVPVCGKHYLTPSAADFARATGLPDVQRAAIALQQTSADSGTDGQAYPDPSPQVGNLQQSDEPKRLLRKDLATPRGFEPRLSDPKSLVLPLHHGVVAALTLVDCCSAAGDAVRQRAGRDV